jgi:hypothetical protein
MSFFFGLGKGPAHRPFTNLFTHPLKLDTYKAMDLNKCHVYYISNAKSTIKRQRTSKRNPAKQTCLFIFEPCVQSKIKLQSLRFLIHAFACFFSIEAFSLPTALRLNSSPVCYASKPNVSLPLARGRT